MKQLLFSIFCGIYLLGCSNSNPTEEEEAPNNQSFEEEVFQMEDPERTQWQKPNLVLERMQISAGDVIADIGAGTGYFTFPLAEKAHKVIAIDIDERYLQFIESRKHSTNMENIEIRRTKNYDPLLSREEANIILMVNTFHQIENKSLYLEKLKRGLCAGGKLFLIDYFKRTLPMGPEPAIKTSKEEVISALEKLAFEVKVDTTLLPYQYFIEAVSPMPNFQE